MSCIALSELPPPPPDKTGWPWTEAGKPLPENGPDGRPWPRISIVTPSYNQGRFIEAAIRSVLLQGYPNLEYIVIDGGSKDNSVEIIRRYAPWLTYWIFEPDRGQSHALNKGFARASGDIYAWLNSDDILLSDALRHVISGYNDRPNAVAWVGDCYWVTPEQKVINRVEPKGLDKHSLGDWWYGGFFMQPSCFFTAGAWERAGGLDETLHYAMDLDLWLKLASMGSFHRVREALSAATLHSSAKTQTAIPQMNAETAYVQFKHGYREAATGRLVRLLSQPPVATGLRMSGRHALRRCLRVLLSGVRGSNAVRLPELSEVLHGRDIARSGSSRNQMDAQV